MEVISVTIDFKWNGYIYSERPLLKLLYCDPDYIFKPNFREIIIHHDSFPTTLFNTKKQDQKKHHTYTRLKIFAFHPMVS